MTKIVRTFDLFSLTILGSLNFPSGHKSSENEINKLYAEFKNPLAVARSFEHWRWNGNKIRA